ncbi:MAG: hypothetical protein VB048_05410 [Bacteroidaceae bacterium]|nr:hypothetical protein [Bacteroidales bacterium]MEA4967540.1 hypothetical protein [Bacteroidaceae bacterium]MEA5099413.1 hypothetical protein [Bacteroidales bacterium]
MKKSYFIGIIITLLLLLGVNIFFFLSNSCCSNLKEEKIIEKSKIQCYVSETLSLDKAQQKKYTIIKKEHQNIAIRIADSLHLSQEVLMNYIENKPYDTTAINKLENKVTYFQKQLLHQSVEQYYKLKNILHKDQISSMDDIYRQIFVCRPTCKNNSKCCCNNGKKTSN